jgi:hypothetical protein
VLWRLDLGAWCTMMCLAAALFSVHISTALSIVDPAEKCARNSLWADFSTSRSSVHTQTLMYESAACAHGRRRVLKGRYYASAFAHYQPVDPSVWNYTIAVSGSVGVRCVARVISTRMHYYGAYALLTR